MPAPAAVGDLSSQLALDAGALDKLKLQAKSDPRQALSAAANQFEALFMQMMLKSMREALPQDGPLSSEATKSYTGMFDQQIAQQLAKKGIGVAGMLVKQLSGSLGKAEAATDPAAATTTLEKARAALAQRSAALAGSAVQIPAKDAPVVAAPPQPTAPSAPLGSVGEVVQSFVEKLRPYAEAVAQKLGVPAHYLIAQAGLETGWGKSQPRTADGAPSNNLFGIKATTAWKGSSVAATTTEYTAGQAEKMTASFRAYGSYSDSLQDFANLLTRSRRYANALANTHDAGKYAASLQEAGYATDPRYAEKLTRAIQMVARYSPETAATARAPQVARASADIRSDQA